jgi:hypothetical protein
LCGKLVFHASSSGLLRSSARPGRLCASLSTLSPWPVLLIRGCVALMNRVVCTVVECSSACACVQGIAGPSTAAEQPGATWWRHEFEKLVMTLCCAGATAGFSLPNLLNLCPSHHYGVEGPTWLCLAARDPPPAVPHSECACHTLSSTPTAPLEQLHRGFPAASHRQRRQHAAADAAADRERESWTEQRCCEVHAAPRQTWPNRAPTGRRCCRHCRPMRTSECAGDVLAACDTAALCP